MQLIDIIRDSVVRVRADLSPGWLDETTQMRADLGMTSIDLLNVLALVTQATGKKIMYEALLLPEGHPRAELTLGELAEFVAANLGAAAPVVAAM